MAEYGIHRVDCLQGTSTGFGGETSTASPTKTSSEPAKDISHMIRKKVCRGSE